MQEEVWKDVENYQGLYQVSSLGRVKALPKIKVYSDGRIYRYKEKILKFSIGTSGYPTLHFYNESGERETVVIHRLVAKAFLTGVMKETVNHIDGDKTNNSVSNLEWASYKENNNHAISTGLHKGTPSGYTSKLSKLSKEAREDILLNCRKGVRGFTCQDFANKYGVSSPTIQRVVNKRDKLIGGASSG